MLAIDIFQKLIKQRPSSERPTSQVLAQLVKASKNGAKTSI